MNFIINSLSIVLSDYIRQHLNLRKYLEKNMRDVQKLFTINIYIFNACIRMNHEESFIKDFSFYLSYRLMTKSTEFNTASRSKQK